MSGSIYEIAELSTVDRTRTVSPVYLVLRDDDLGTIGVLGARDRVLEEADCADDLALLDDTNLATLTSLTGTKVAWVADDLLGLHGLSAATDTNKLAIRVGDDLVDRLVKHVGTAVDGTQTRKRLRQLAETVQGVDVWRLAIPGHGRRVEDDALVCWTRGLLLVAVLDELRFGMMDRNTYSSSR